MYYSRFYISIFNHPPHKSSIGFKSEDIVGKKIGLMLSISKTAKLKSEEWILALSKTKSIGISKDNKSRTDYLNWTIIFFPFPFLFYMDC